MQVNKYILIFVLFSFIASSCKKKVSKEEYVVWVKDYSNGLHKKKQVEDIVFDVQYKPKEFVALHERRNFQASADSSMQVEQTEKLQYFTLKLQVAGANKDFLKHGISSEKEYYDKLYYYSFHFQNDIYLESEGKQLPCKLFHFERSYDLTASRTFVLAFPNTESEADKTLVIDSKDLGLGPVKINFNKKDLNSIPEIKL